MLTYICLQAIAKQHNMDHTLCYSDLVNSLKMKINNPLRDEKDEPQFWSPPKLGD